LLVLIAMVTFLEWRTGRFLQAGNLSNLATDSALLGVCALGAAVVILAGGIDISLGALMALSAATAGRLWEQGQPPPVVAVVALGVGTAGGLLNAVLTLAGRVHPIVVTLAMMNVYRGLTLWRIDEDVHIDGTVRAAFTARPFDVPVLVWVGLTVAVVVWLMLARTVFGREVYAVGGNPAAARRVGISVTRVWLKAFALQGLLAGLAGLLYLGYSGHLQPTDHEDKTLSAIAAAVVGGVAISGGRGSAAGVLLGCVFLAALAPAGQFLGVPPTWQRTLVGAVMAVAVAIDALGRRRET
jgi:ribose transport system permease protein